MDDLLSDFDQNGIFAGADMSAVPDDAPQPSADGPAARALPPPQQARSPLPEAEADEPLVIMPPPATASFGRAPAASHVRHSQARRVSSAFGDAVPQESAHMLGVSVLLFSLGAVLGVRYGGAYGGVAGGLAGGAVSNALRAFLYLRTAGTSAPEAQAAVKREALVSGTYAVVAAGGAAYLWYKVVQKPMTSNESSSKPSKSLMRFEDNLGPAGVRRSS